MSEGVLKKFYNSDEWKDFRITIILKRKPICQDCGKLITEQKEVQVHHIIELTEDNYKDVTISLNPDNVKVLCLDCHNITHDRFCKGQRKKVKERGVYIVYGPPGSGKTSYVLENKRFDDIVVDMDRLYEAVTMLPRYDKPDKLRFNVFSIQNTLIDNIKTRYGNFNSAWIIGGYADKFKRERLATDLGAELILIEATKEECIERLMNSNDYREENIKEWEKYIEKWFQEYC